MEANKEGDIKYVVYGVDIYMRMEGDKFAVPSNTGRALD